MLLEFDICLQDILHLYIRISTIMRVIRCVIGRRERYTEACRFIDRNENLKLLPIFFNTKYVFSPLAIADKILGILVQKGTHFFSH